MSRSLLLMFALVGCAGGGNDGSETDDTDDTDTEDTDTEDTDTEDTDTVTPGSLFTDMVPEVVATASDGLAKPSDIEFQPTTGKAFVMNRKDDSLVILHAPDASDPEADRRGGEDDVVGANHFLARPSALAFSDNGDWASAHMEDKRTQGFGGTPADFMGPTLWTGDTSILDGGHATHLDMLHNSPNGAGIAWVSDNDNGPNAYYMVDGWNESVTFYDFANDHGLGGADHTDGIIHRMLEGEISYVDGVVSHLVYDEGLLYVVDTGNNRIIGADPSTGSLGNPLAPNYDGLGVDKFNYMDGVDFWDMVDTEAAGMEQPAGMELHEGILYVTDRAQGYVYAFDLASGDYLDSMDLGVGSDAVQGMGIDDNGTLWFCDDKNDQVLKLVAE